MFIYQYNSKWVYNEENRTSSLTDKHQTILMSRKPLKHQTASSYIINVFVCNTPLGLIHLHWEIKHVSLNSES